MTGSKSVKMSKAFKCHDFSLGTKILHLFYIINWNRNMDIN